MGESGGSVDEYKEGEITWWFKSSARLIESTRTI